MPDSPSPAESDADRVRSALAGDREAFGRLYDRHAAGVRAVAGAVSKDWDAIEDLTQETFVRAYSRLASLRKPEGFGEWVRGVARQVARERLRALRRQAVTTTNRAAVEGLASSPESPRADHLDETKRALEAMRDLAEAERLAVHAYFFNEERSAEAARSIGLSRSGFYAAFNRGMARLRRRLGVTPDSPSAVRRSP